MRRFNAAALLRDLERDGGRIILDREGTLWIATPDLEGDSLERFKAEIAGKPRRRSAVLRLALPA